MHYTEICFVLLCLFQYSVVMNAQIDENPIESNDEKPGGPYVYNDTRPSQMGFMPAWDPNGYVFFCLCMGALLPVLELWLTISSFFCRMLHMQIEFSHNGHIYTIHCQAWLTSHAQLLVQDDILFELAGWWQHQLVPHRLHWGGGAKSAIPDCLDYL